MSVRVTSDPIAFARALADPTRWRIVHLVFDRALCVCELAEVLRLPQSTLSSHLRVIEKAGLLDCERRQKWLFYRVKPGFQPLLRAMFRHFESDGESVPALARDARKAGERILRREVSCCPAPQILVNRNRKPKT
jgi:ArsR family transcriptional regulator, arsenate/arsenite/antimonite-responsive transcriptional repressor